MYAVGIDIGTTYTAAAVWRDGRAEIAPLGSHAAAIPSVVFVRSDGTVLTGENAGRRGLSEPNRVAREFPRRLGDTAPTLLGGTPYSAAALTARMLRSVLDTVTAREGSPPDAICLSHPASWGPYKTDLLRQVIRLADIDQPVQLTTDAQAAADFHAQKHQLTPGATIAVYDLGGGTFDAAVLRKTATGFDIIGRPEGLERLGGIDFDATILTHVTASLEQIDTGDPALVRLRAECVQAKEALSTDTDTTIPVLLPTVSTQVRLTRSDLETMLRPALQNTIDVLLRTIRSAGYSPQALGSVLLVGGSARMPIVAQMISEAVGQPVTVDANPKLAVALGAAQQAGNTIAGPAASETQPVIPPVRDTARPTPTPAAPKPQPVTPPVREAAAPPTPAAPRPQPVVPPVRSASGPAPASPKPVPMVPPVREAAAPPPTPAAPKPVPVVPPVQNAAGTPPTPVGGSGGAAPKPVPVVPPVRDAAGPVAPMPESDEPTGEIPVVGGPAAAAAELPPDRPPLPKAGVTGRVAIGPGGQPAPWLQPPPAPPPAKAAKRRIPIMVAAAAVLLLAAGGTAWAIARSGDRDDTVAEAATGQPPASSAPVAAPAVPADEQCTDAMKKSTRWVCLTKATLHDNTFTVWYEAEWNGSTPDINKGFHLHLYGGDGTRPDESTMGSQAVEHSKYYYEDQEPSVRKTSSDDFEAVGDAVKVCARIARSGHGLAKASDGSYHTGNCIPIQRD